MALYRRLRCSVAVALCLSALTPARSADPLQQELDTLLETPVLRGTSIAVLAIRADTGRVLRARNADFGFVPASNVKLITCAMALRQLGGWFRFHTDVCAPMGRVSCGSVRGNLYLIGSWDPSLTSAHLCDLVEHVRRRGIQRITGSVVSDEPTFAMQRWRSGWNWDDLCWYYCPEISALSLNRNQVDVVIKPTQPGRRASVTFSPATHYLQIVNQTITGKRQTNTTTNGRKHHCDTRS